MSKNARAALLAVVVTGAIHLGVGSFMGMQLKVAIGSRGASGDPRQTSFLFVCACVTTLAFSCSMLRKNADTVGAAAAMSGGISAAWACALAYGQLGVPLVVSGGSRVDDPVHLSTLAGVGAAGLVAGAALFSAMRRARALVAGAALLLGAVTLVGGVRSSRRPEPDAFRDLMEHHELPQNVKVAVGPLGFERRGATLLVTRPDGAEEDYTGGGLVADAPSVIDRDPVTGLVVGRYEHDLPRFGPPTAHPIMSANADKVYTGVVISDFPRRLGVPRAWLRSATCGFLFAVFVIAAASVVERRRRARIEGLIEGEHTGGWVTLPDRSPVFVDVLAKSPPGAVLARVRKDPTATYRKSGLPDRVDVELGSRESARANARSRATALASLGVATLLATCAPLWASWACGLLW